MKIKVHMDKTAYQQKPKSGEMAGIKARLQNNSAPRNMEISDIIQRLERGYAISPAVMGGMRAADWQEQRLFMVDVDNDAADIPILSPTDALIICQRNDLQPVFYYPTYSDKPDKPKYWIAFITDEPITDINVREKLMQTLVSLFPQSDTACVNADRFFLGTNKPVIINNLDARISVDEVLAVPKPPSNETRRYVKNLTADFELENLKRDFDFLGFLKERNGECIPQKGGYKFKNCEICGHHNDLMYYTSTNTFYCFSANGGVGGSIIEYLMAAEKLTLEQAIDKFKYELCDIEWQEPKPLEDFILSPFPVDCLPTPLNDFVSAVALNTGTPVDMGAVSTLAMISAAVQGKYQIQGKSDYFEPLNLYHLIVANPGERKSAIIRIITDAIYKYEREENKKRILEIAKEQAQLDMWQKQIKNYEKSGKHKEADALRVKYNDLTRNMTKPIRIIADDITPEALASVMSDNGGRITIISTEGGFFDILNGKYSTNKAVSLDTVLKAWSGDNIRVDRQTRELQIIDNPALTMLLATQEFVLAGLMNNNDFNGKGLTARIMYCKPLSKIGTRPFETPSIPSELKQAYTDLLQTLLNLPYPKNSIPVLYLSENATAVYKRFNDKIERMLIAELEDIREWAAKCVGTCLRIAGILHCAKYKTAPDKALVLAGTMKNAVKITEYFIEHAKYAYFLMGADKILQNAKYILRRLEKQPERELTESQIHHLCRKFKKQYEMRPSLELLAEHGYMKLRSYSAPTGGRPRGKCYILNPLYFDKHI